MFEDLLGAVALDPLIAAVHYALRMLRHRADGKPQLRAFGVKGLKSEPTPEEKELTLRLIKQIEKQEQKSIKRLSERRVDSYVTALADIVQRRMRDELAYNRQRGERMLETLRDR